MFLLSLKAVIKRHFGSRSVLYYDKNNIEAPVGMLTAFFYLIYCKNNLYTSNNSNTICNKKIEFESRFFGNYFMNCLVSIDGTDTPIQEPYQFSTEWYSYKLNGPGWRYSIGLSINIPDICWINEPFKPGIVTGLEIFRHKLKSGLEEEDRIYGDRIYRDVKCLNKDDVNGNDYRFLCRILARREILHGRLKRFNVLNNPFSHELQFHAECFYASENIAQYAIKN